MTCNRTYNPATLPSISEIPGWTRRLAVRSLGVAALLGGSAAVCLAGAGPAAAAPPTGPVLVGPLLDFFGFGANIGLPLVCGTGAAAIGSGASQYGLAHEASGLVNAINSACASASQYGAQFIAEGEASDAPLSQLNPVVNPVLQSAANSFPQIASTFGPALNPFSATIAALGGTITWFEGN